MTGSEKQGCPSGVTNSNIWENLENFPKVSNAGEDFPLVFFGLGGCSYPVGYHRLKYSGSYFIISFKLEISAMYCLNFWLFRNV